MKDAKESYLKLIRSMIEANKRYPLIARRQHWEGKVGVRFTINSSLKVEDIKVVSSSGHQILDRAAISAIESASPFPAPPDLNIMPLNIELVIVFQLL